MFNDQASSRSADRSIGRGEDSDGASINTLNLSSDNIETGRDVVGGRTDHDRTLVLSNSLWSRILTLITIL